MTTQTLQKRSPAAARGVQSAEPTGSPTPPFAPHAACGPEVTFLEDWNQMDGLERAISFGALSRVPADNLQLVLSKLEEVTVVQGDVIFEQGQAADAYYIVKSGTAEVCRRGAHGHHYRLGLKRPGDAFGEGGLVLEGSHSAMVRMLTGGTLLRISKPDFLNLVVTALIQPTESEEARQLAAAGARWLDVRDEAAFRRGAMPNALNAPLALLRLRRRSLADDATYLVYGDDRASAMLGCYLLAERGFKARFVTEPATRLIAPPMADAAPARRTKRPLADRAKALHARLQRKLRDLREARDAARAEACRLRTRELALQAEIAALRHEFERRDDEFQMEMARLRAALAARLHGPQREVA